MLKLLSLLGIAASLTLSAPTIPEINLDNFKEPVVEYTSDSVIDYGILLEPLRNEDGTLSVKIILDFDFGYKLFDNPDTAIIEGIRVNGAEITSLIIEGYNPEEYLTVTVKTVYKDGAEGILAQLADGTYDYSNLLSNPVMLMQVIYYAIAALSLIIGGFGLLKSRRLKVKTAEDIAQAVDARAKETQDILATKVMGLLNPALSKMSASNSKVIQAMMLSTNKSKESTLALLDLMNQASDNNLNEVMNKAKEFVEQSSAKEEAAKQDAINALTNIAMSNQEANANEKTVNKSIF